MDELKPDYKNMAAHIRLLPDAYNMGAHDANVCNFSSDALDRLSAENKALRILLNTDGWSDKSLDDAGKWAELVSK